MLDEFKKEPLEYCIDPENAEELIEEQLSGEIAFEDILSNGIITLYKVNCQFLNDDQYLTMEQIEELFPEVKDDDSFDKWSNYVIMDDNCLYHN